MQLCPGHPRDVNSEQDQHSLYPRTASSLRDLEAHGQQSPGLPALASVRRQYPLNS